MGVEVRHARQTPLGPAPAESTVRETVVGEQVVTTNADA